MKALITGASSGIGREISLYLSSLGYDLIIVARRKDLLLKIKEQCNTNVDIICMDLEDEKNCFKLYKKLECESIDILVNNAGFGLFGKFENLDIEKEIEMINLNIRTVHILTKLFLKDMIKNDKGYILNVASAAAFAPGPLMATYYSTKSYVFRLSESIYEELKQANSNVHISVLCPGPVDTEFNSVADVKFSFKPLNSQYVAKYAINKLFKKKLIIVPSLFMKFNRLFSKLFPDKFLAKIIYRSQKRKKD